jgi:tRNA threonylcarbamoyladenosine biosynthesis protein TsaE
MPEIQLETAGAQQTERLGEALAAALAPGDVVLVAGELGAGKTTLVRGACRALGVRENVTSPTFVIGQTYSGQLPVSHLDLYRLETLAGEDPALLADYLRSDCVAFVEWPERAGGALDSERVVLSLAISHAGDDRRSISASGDRGPIDALAAAWVEQ